MHEIVIFEIFRGLQLQLSGVRRINLHDSYSFLVLCAECTPLWYFKNLLQLQLHDLMVFEFQM